MFGQTFFNPIAPRPSLEDQNAYDEATQRELELDRNYAGLMFGHSFFNPIVPMGELYYSHSALKGASTSSSTDTVSTMEMVTPGASRNLTIKCHNTEIPEDLIRDIQSLCEKKGVSVSLEECTDS